MLIVRWFLEYYFDGLAKIVIELHFNRSCRVNITHRYASLIQSSPKSRKQLNVKWVRSIANCILSIGSPFISVERSFIRAYAHNISTTTNNCMQPAVICVTLLHIYVYWYSVFTVHLVCAEFNDSSDVADGPIWNSEWQPNAI